MVLSRFPQGIDTPFVSGFGSIPFTTGRRYWVDGGGKDAGDAQDPDHPFLTMAYAATRIAASKGDQILLMPGHTEDIEADDTVAWAEPGCHVIGLGHGADRATFTVKTLAAAGIILDKASTVLQNLLFLSDIDDLTDPIVVNAADCALLDIEWRDASAKETIDVIWLKSGAVRCLIDGLLIRGNVGGNSGQSGLHLDGCDDCVIRSFDIHGDYQTGNIENVGDEVLRIRLGGLGNSQMVKENVLWCSAPEDLAIALDTLATGKILGPIALSLVDNAANIDECIVPGNCFVYQTGGKTIGIVNAAGESELQWPGTPSIDAA